MTMTFRRRATSPLFALDNPITSCTPSEYANPFFRQLDNQRYWLLKLDVHQRKVSVLRAADANDTATAEEGTSLDSLRALVSTISRGEALASSEEFDRPLSQAVQHHGTPDDIPEWADRLASEAGQLND